MNIYKYKKYIPIGISLPTKIVKTLDKKEMRQRKNNDYSI